MLCFKFEFIFHEYEANWDGWSLSCRLTDNFIPRWRHLHGGKEIGHQWLNDVTVIEVGFQLVGGVVSWLKEFVSPLGIISRVTSPPSTKERMKSLRKKNSNNKRGKIPITIIRRRRWKMITVKIYFDQPSQHWPSLQREEQRDMKRRWPHMNWILSSSQFMQSRIKVHFVE